jgi:hypothetical protein
MGGGGRLSVPAGSHDNWTTRLHVGWWPWVTAPLSFSFRYVYRIDCLTTPLNYHVALFICGRVTKFFSLRSSWRVYCTPPPKKFLSKFFSLQSSWRVYCTPPLKQFLSKFFSLQSSWWLYCTPPPKKFLSNFFSLQSSWRVYRTPPLKQFLSKFFSLQPWWVLLHTAS